MIRKFLRSVVRMERIDKESLPLKKLNCQGWNVRLCSLMRRSRSLKKQLSLRKKSKNVHLQEFVRLSKLLFSLFKSLNGRSHLQSSYVNDDTNLLNITYLNWSIIAKLQNVKNRQSKDGQNDNDMKDNHVIESCQNKPPPAKWRDDSASDKYSELHTKNYGGPKLSSMHKRNFRVGLYVQLNVVGRRPKQPSYYCSSSFRTNRGYYPTFERSTPKAMNNERMIDYYDGSDNDCEGPIGPVSQSDTEDVFALDII